MDNKFEREGREGVLQKLFQIQQEIDENGYAADLGSLSRTGRASNRQDELIEKKRVIEKNIGNRNTD